MITVRPEVFPPVVPIAAALHERVAARYTSTFQLPKIMHTAPLSAADRVKLSNAILGSLGAEDSWTFMTKDQKNKALGVLQQTPGVLLALPAEVALDRGADDMMQSVMKTEGDGNCLFHGASLCMWGCHDYNVRFDKVAASGSPRPSDLAGLRSHFNRVIGDEVAHAEFRTRWLAASQITDWDEATEREWDIVTAPLRLQNHQGG
jgi:hypothetical protein